MDPARARRPTDALLLMQQGSGSGSATVPESTVGEKPTGLQRQEASSPPSAPATAPKRSASNAVAGRHASTAQSELSSLLADAAGLWGPADVADDDEDEEEGGEEEEGGDGGNRRRKWRGTEGERGRGVGGRGGGMMASKVREDLQAERRERKKRKRQAASGGDGGGAGGGVGGGGVSSRDGSGGKWRADGGGRRRMEVGPSQVRAVCKFYLTGSCKKGKDCEFSHSGEPRTKSQACRFEILGSCLRGADCPFSHDLRKFPCKFFHLRGPGGCLDGDRCRFSHAAVTNKAELDRLTQLVKGGRERGGGETVGGDRHNVGGDAPESNGEHKGFEYGEGDKRPPSSGVLLDDVLSRAAGFFAFDGDGQDEKHSSPLACGANYRGPMHHGNGAAGDGVCFSDGDPRNGGAQAIAAASSAAGAQSGAVHAAVAPLDTVLTRAADFFADPQTTGQPLLHHPPGVGHRPPWQGGYNGSDDADGVYDPAGASDPAGGIRHGISADQRFMRGGGGGDGATAFSAHDMDSIVGLHNGHGVAQESSEDREHACSPSSSHHGPREATPTDAAVNANASGWRGDAAQQGASAGAAADLPARAVASSSGGPNWNGSLSSRGSGGMRACLAAGAAAAGATAAGATAAGAAAAGTGKHGGESSEPDHGVQTSGASACSSQALGRSGHVPAGSGSSPGGGPPKFVWTVRVGGGEEQDEGDA